MSPEQKAKLIKVFVGALAAGGLAMLGYLTTHWTDVFSGAAFGTSFAAAAYFLPRA